eukprot:Rmarinus@m.20014
MEGSLLVKDKRSCAVVIASVLEDMVDINAPFMSYRQLRKYGMHNDPSEMPLQIFINSLLLACTPVEAVCGLIYVRRLLHAPSSMLDTDSFPALTPYNVHRVFFTGVVLANIQWNDVPYSSQAWARWSTLWPRESVDRMKLTFLKGLDWRLHISRTEFETAVTELETLCLSL